MGDRLPTVKDVAGDLFIEAGLFVALTAAALGAAIWLLHRRPA
jgi:hypothetical protein